MDLLGLYVKVAWNFKNIRYLWAVLFITMTEQSLQPNTQILKM